MMDMTDTNNAFLRQPLHRQLAFRLRREVATRYRAGDRMESQNDLAERYAVSVLTVREALSGLEEEGIIERRRGSGTYVVDPTMNLVVAVLMELDIAHPGTGYGLRRLTQRARFLLRQRGYRARLYAGYVEPGGEGDPFRTQMTTCPEFLDDLHAGRICGVAVLAGASQQLLSQIHSLDIPMVDASVLPKSPTENIGAMVLSAGLDALIALGRRRLAFMSWGNPQPVIEATRARSLELRPEWMRCDLHPAVLGSGAAEFREIWNAHDDIKPDGLLVTDEVLFTDAARVISHLGIKIPEELAIASRICRGEYAPVPFPFTRIETDPDEEAERLVAKLAGLLAQNPVEDEPPLTVRVYDDPDECTSIAHTSA